MSQNATGTNTLVSVGRLYRGILINEDAQGFSILDESGRRYDFESRLEAEKFVDAWYAMQYVVSTTSE